MATVLVLEDDEQVRVLAESCLREQGHQTISAATPAEALAVLDVADGLDVLFVDIGLTEGVQAGLEVAKEAARRLPNLKVLYTTGHGITDGTKALMVEGSAFLEKPYTIDQLQTSLVVHFGIKPRAD